MEDLVLGAKPLMNWNNPEAPLLGGFGFGGGTLPGAGGETLLGGTPAWRIWFWGRNPKWNNPEAPLLGGFGFVTYPSILALVESASVAPHSISFS